MAVCVTRLGLPRGRGNDGRRDLVGVTPRKGERFLTPSWLGPQSPAGRRASFESLRTNGWGMDRERVGGPTDNEWGATREGRKEIGSFALRPALNRQPGWDKLAAAFLNLRFLRSSSYGIRRLKNPPSTG